MHAIGIVLLSLLAVVVSGFVARMTRLPVPLVQIALGAAIFQSSLTSVVLDPELFFLLFLAPLLFLDGWRLPKDALVRDVGVMLTLALGLVVFTAADRTRTRARQGPSRPGPSAHAGSSKQPRARCIEAPALVASVCSPAY